MSDITLDRGHLLPGKPVQDDGFNESKVDRIRKAWKGGEYSPDSKEIAGHLVEWLKSE